MILKLYYHELNPIKLIFKTIVLMVKKIMKIEKISLVSEIFQPKS